MRMTVLGCAGSIPAADGPCSSYLLEAEGFRMLVDFGTGALGALQRHGDMFDIDAIVLSHLHPDHCADTAAYVVARHYYPPAGRTLPRIPLHGPAGTADRLEAIGGPGIGMYAKDVFEFSSLLRGTLDIGPFHLTLAHVNHPIETFGMRIEHDSKALTYSSDTGESNALVELAQETDLFLCEATWLDSPDNPVDVHLSGRQAGEAATKANVNKLVLTHIVRALADPIDIAAEARGSFAGEIELARPGAVYEL